MKRKLFSQMMQEWRDNLWLILGLAIVSLAIWLFCSGLFSVMRYYFLPMGFEEENVYILSIGTLDPETSAYTDFGDETEEKNSDDLRGMISRIRKSPNVEAAGFTYYGAPYQGSSYNGSLYIVGNEPDSIGFSAMFRFMSPEVVRVLRFKSLTGKDEDYLLKKLEEGEIFVSPDPFYEKKAQQERTFRGDYRIPSYYRAAEELLGKYVYTYKDTLKRFHVADIVPLIRRYHYDDPYQGGAIMPIDEADVIKATNILVRVKPGCGEKFRREFESTPELQSRRNIYLYNLTRITDNKKSIERNDMLDSRLYLTLIGFLLIILFLGLLGTFWFRMRQRVSEIAIRRVCGASKGAIFRRIIAEGMILLIGASVLAGIVGWIIVKKTNLIEGYTNSEILWFELATMVIVAIGIIISLSYPAWKAMNIEPAVAVRDE